MDLNSMAPDRLVDTVRRVLPSRSPASDVIERLPESGRASASYPPLLFVHGAYHGAWCWDENWMPEAAARGWRCYAVDLGGRANGDGERRSRWRLRDYEREVMQAVSRLPEAPVLVGHSVGAVVVQRLLTDYPAPAGVLVAPVPVHGGYRLPLRILRRHPGDLVRLGLLRSLPPRTDYFFSDRLDDDTARAYADRMEPASGLTQLEAALPRWGNRTAERAQAPVLVIGAEDDALVDPVDVVRTARAYGGRARMFRGMGHDMMLDAGWRAPLEVMLHWLRDEITV